MRRSLRCPAVLFALASCASCAATPPPAAPPPTIPVAAAPKPLPEPEPPPVHLMMRLTVAHPRSSFTAVQGLLAGNPAWQKASATLQLLGMGMASSVDLDRPAFLAMAENKEFAVSLDVTPGQAPALAQRLHLEQAADGGYRIPHDGLDAAKGPFACAITPVLGSAPASPSDRLRLVCAVDAHAVQTFSPVLARMTAPEGGPDVRLTMDGEPIRTGMIEGSQKTRGRGTRAEDRGAAIGEKLVVDVANDLDTVTWDASLHDDFDAAMTFHFRSDTSPFVHALTAHPERAAPPPEALWHLPSDADMAFFSQGAEANDLEGVRSVVWPALDDVLKEDSCNQAVAYFDERIHKLFLTGGPLVLGIGTDIAGGQKALAAYRALKKPTDAARSTARRALDSWVLFEVDEPAAKWVDGLRDTLTIEKKFPDCKAANPPAGGPPKKKEETKTIEVAVPASAHLPSGTLHIANHAKPTKDATSETPPEHTTHFFIVPDGTRTWIGMGDNEALVLAKVRASLHDAPSSGTLAARSGLDGLHAPAAGGGFITAKGIISSQTKDVTDDDLRAADSKLAVLSTFASKGVLPLPIWWRATSSDVSVRMTLPRTALKELIPLLKQER